MKPAKYSRSCRRRRKVKMSDCHSWLGAARSKRRGGCSRAGAASAAGISPSSCRIRRTSVSDTPSASKRRSAALMRRVPYSGCSRRISVTASRLAVAAALGARFFRGRTSVCRPAAPCFSYRWTQSATVE
jgi:hypothetical protein